MDIESRDETIMSVGLAVLWPITAPFAASLYMALASFESAKNIKRRIKDRGLEREFYAWLDDRKKPASPPETQKPPPVTARGRELFAESAKKWRRWLGSNQR